MSRPFGGISSNFGRLQRIHQNTDRRAGNVRNAIEKALEMEIARIEAEKQEEIDALKSENDRLRTRSLRRCDAKSNLRRGSGIKKRKSNKRKTCRAANGQFKKCK